MGLSTANLTLRDTTCEFIERLQEHSTKSASLWSPNKGSDCVRRTLAYKKNKLKTFNEDLKGLLRGVSLAQNEIAQNVPRVLRQLSGRFVRGLHHVSRSIGDLIGSSAIDYIRILRIGLELACNGG